MRLSRSLRIIFILLFIHMNIETIKEEAVKLPPEEQDMIITEILKNRNNRISTPVQNQWFWNVNIPEDNPESSL